MKKLVLVCGPAGIGKSSFCKKYISEHPDENIFIVSSDETRKGFYGAYDRFPPDNNMMTIYSDMVRQIDVLHATHDNVTVIVDSTMLTDERRLYFLNSCHKFDVNVCILLKLHDYSQCFERNKQRQTDKIVPEEVIRSMISKYTDPSESTAKLFDIVETIYKD